MVSFEPSADERLLCEQLRRFCADVVRPNARDWEEGGVPDAVATECVRLGIGAVEVPPLLGGLGLGLLSRLLVEEELAWGDAGLATALPGPGAPYAVLSGENADAWAGATMDKRTALVLGTSGRSCARFERARHTLIVHGGAATALHGALADHLLLLAADEDEIPLLLWLRSERLRLNFDIPEQRLGLRAVRTQRLRAQEVPVEPDAIVMSGDDVTAAVRAGLIRLRLQAAAHATGVARAAMEYATRYATERKTFGRALAEHQAVGFMIADAGIGVESARAALWYAASGIDRGDPAGEHVAALATAQAFETALDVTSAAVQVLGGHGYVQDHPVEKWMRDARTLATWWPSTD